MSTNNFDNNEESNSIIQCEKCGEIIIKDNTKLYNDLLSQNKNINNMLNELKDKIESININLNEKNILEKNISSIKTYINIIIKENEKNKKELEDKLNQDKLNNKDILDKFDIKLKELITKVKYHSSYINCSTVLNDGRIATGGNDGSIIIYNKEKFNPDIIINEHEDDIKDLLQLSSGYLASCSKDRTIKLFNIAGKEYNIIQTLTYHKYGVNKLIELNNQKLVSCSNAQNNNPFLFSNSNHSIIFYIKDKNKNKDNNEYIMDFSIKSDYQCNNIIQTKDNEVCYSETNLDYHALCFFDFAERKNISKLNDIVTTCIKKISKDLLLIGGRNLLYIINFNSYNIIRIINSSKSNLIYDICILNDNILFTGDEQGNIRQWRILGDKLIQVSEKKIDDFYSIKSLLKISDEHIISCDDQGTLKYW